MAAIRADFRDECADLIERLQEALRAIPSGSAAAADPIHTAFRAAHTIKGGAASLGHGALAARAHAFENRLATFRDAPASLTEIDRISLMAGADALAAVAETWIDTHESARDSDEDNRATTLRLEPQPGFFRCGLEMRRILSALLSLAPADVTCDAGGLPPLSTLDAGQCNLSWHVRFHAPVLRSAIDGVLELAADLIRVTFEPVPQPVAPASPPATMRIALDRVERLLDLVGELATGQTMLAEPLREAGFGRHNPAAVAADAIGKLTRDLQDAVVAMRAQPILPLLRRMERTMRETAAALGKSCRMTLEGETTEVDRLLLDALAEPLVHIVRNAVDHGIEPADRRLAAGKPVEGHLTLAVSHRAGRVVIEIADDGRGIDTDRVITLARARGLVRVDEIVTEAEAYALLFQPGFSTADALSDVSGRGVGLDAAAQAIRALGGRILLTSDPGEGARFTLSLPLTLAVLDGMLVEAGGQVLVLPLPSVIETAAWRRAALCETLGGCTVTMRDRSLPVRDLAAALGFGATDRTAPQAVLVRIADEEGRECAVLVERILDQRQVVIKGIDRHCGAIAGVSAATVLGDGTVALILDPGALIKGRPLSPCTAELRLPSDTGQAMPAFGDVLLLHHAAGTTRLPQYPVREIRRWSRPARLPGGGPSSLGAINHRGTIIPVHDLAGRVDPAARDRGQHPVIVVIEDGGRLMGLAADSISVAAWPGRDAGTEAPSMEDR